MSHDRDVVTDPVHDKDLVDVESLLQQFGCDGHRVKVAETPETATKRERAEWSYQLLSNAAVPKPFPVPASSFYSAF